MSDQYRIRYANKRVRKAILKLPPKDFELIDTAILSLRFDPRPTASKKLRATKEPTYELKVWPYRILYDVYDNDRMVLILAVVHRKDLGKYLRTSRL
jgi:mRNA-degrading endonuclease RelE of RelBE toxin-antitoxin system